MSFQSNDVLLDETIHRFFADSIMDFSLNFLRNLVPEPEPEPDNDSIPDLIENVEQPQPPPDQGMQLWANVLNDYHHQMKLYQENVRTILDITRNFLPQRTTTLPSDWRDILRNNVYSIEIDRIIPALFPTNTTNNNVPPTNTQITYATSVFTCDLSNNDLISTVCPISLEDFINGESLTRINHCGHVFKTGELAHWFTRNSHCPSCRYDIRV
jgi:hypothetical protein